MLLGGLDLCTHHSQPSEASVCYYLHELQGDPPKSVPMCSYIFRCTLHHPEYVPGYLALREADAMILAVNSFYEKHPHQRKPKALLVDGQGEYHPQREGLAVAVGRALEIPTIGVGKNFLYLPGEIETPPPPNSLLIGAGGIVYGASVSVHGKKPIYVSVGWKIGLEEAVNIVRKDCTFRIPNSLRGADHGSREDRKATLP